VLRGRRTVNVDPTSGLALHGEYAAHAFDELACDDESERAASNLRVCGAESVERLEQMPELLRAEQTLSTTSASSRRSPTSTRPPQGVLDRIRLQVAKPRRLTNSVGAVTARLRSRRIWTALARKRSEKRPFVDDRPVCEVGTVAALEGGMRRRIDRAKPPTTKDLDDMRSAPLNRRPPAPRCRGGASSILRLAQPATASFAWLGRAAELPASISGAPVEPAGSIITRLLPSHPLAGR
jgi:hypothetical protein